MFQCSKLIQITTCTQCLVVIMVILYVSKLAPKQYHYMYYPTVDKINMFFVMYKNCQVYYDCIFFPFLSQASKQIASKFDNSTHSDRMIIFLGRTIQAQKLQNDTNIIPWPFIFCVIQPTVQRCSVAHLISRFHSIQDDYSIWVFFFLIKKSKCQM